MAITLDRTQAPAMPAAFYNLLDTVLSNTTHPNVNTHAITLNFRDPDYSAKSGGFHPVEIRIENHDLRWQLVYVTDFAYRGNPYPELVKVIDICFRSKQIYSLYGGWLNERESIEMLEIFIGNFIEYQSLEVYDVQISFE